MQKVLSALGLLLFSASVWATPAQIVIIRHAEKPANGDEVNQQGCERSFLLPAFFRSNSLIQKFGSIAAVYAEQPGNNGDSSIRPIETIAPTAEALGLKAQDPYLRTDFAALAQSVLSNPALNGKTVVIAWEHNVIPYLAQDLGLSLTSNTKKWPDSVYDEAWVLTFAAAGPSLQIIPESVLPNDNPVGGSQWRSGPTDNPNGSAVPSAVASECQDNNTLNAIVRQVANPEVQP